MTAMMRVALGLLVVLLDISWHAWDLVPDPLGWALVLSGVLPHADRLGGRAALTVVLALVVSLVVYPPAVSRTVDPVVGWLLSLPQLAFGVVLAMTLARQVPEAGRRFARTAAALVAVAVAPIVVVVAGATSLVLAYAVIAALVQLYLVYLLVRFAEWSPGRPADAAGTQTREGPPPNGSGPTG